MEKMGSKTHLWPKANEADCPEHYVEVWDFCILATKSDIMLICWFCVRKNKNVGRESQKCNENKVKHIFCLKKSNLNWNEKKMHL